MPFTLDKDSLLIKGRRGDSASFTFDFGQDVSSYDVYFYVKKNLNSSDVVIEKEYSKPLNQNITVNLTEEDTLKLTAQANSYTPYYWGVKIKNGTEFVQTIIPKGFKTPPMLYVYPAIGNE